MRRSALVARVILVAIIPALQGCTEIPTAHNPEVEASFARSTSEISVGPSVVNPGGQITVHAQRAFFGTATCSSCSAASGTRCRCA